jgi:hypothetical protein
MTMLDSHSDASSFGAFAGFGEDAPLELPNDMTPAAEAAVLSRLLDGSFSAWAETAASVGNCVNPIRLVGSSETVDTRTGEVVGGFCSGDAPLGVLYVPCGNRRANVCPPCSRTYARDTFELLRAGVSGGKTIPTTVADNPLLFVTFTAPSFGHVHRHDKNGKRCRPRDRVKVCEHGRPVGCMSIHGEDDPLNGSPLCWDCYDWTSAIVWQFTAPELWRRTTIALRRAVAQALGAKADQLRSVASMEFAKVAEYQARGLVHFHALIRLDGVEGPGSPAAMGGRELAKVIASAVPDVEAPAPAIDAEDCDRILGWGRQLDIKLVRPGDRTDDPDTELTAEQVAGYLAKYVTKDATSIRRPGATPHLKHMENLCGEVERRGRDHYGPGFRLPKKRNGEDNPEGKPIPDNPYFLLGKWARALGFRGHFSSKSRAYSVTLGRLRRARQRFAVLAAESRRTGHPIDTKDLEARLLAEDAVETTVVVGSWAFQGTGWPNPGDATLAASAAARAREYDQWRAQERKAA